MCFFLFRPALIFFRLQNVCCPFTVAEIFCVDSNSNYRSQVYNIQHEKAAGRHMMEERERKIMSQLYCLTAVPITNGRLIIP